MNKNQKEEKPSSNNNSCELDGLINESISDKISSYWNKNKKSIFFTIALCFVSITSFEGYKMFQKSKNEDLKKDYIKAIKNDSLEDFIRSNTNNKIGGFAALEVANKYFNEGNFKLASKYFNQSKISLGDSILMNRAILGEALSELKIDDKKGSLILEEIISRTDLLESTRAEAAYALANIAFKNGDKEKSQELSEMVRSFNNPGVWLNRFSQFLN